MNEVWVCGNSGIIRKAAKPKYLEKNLPQWYFVDHKSHMGWRGMEPMSVQWYDGN